MRVAVAGGTGVVGAHVVRALEELGHEPVVLARSRGVDLTTGAGLDAALVGAEAVVDVSNVTTLSRRRSTRFFTATTRSLLTAGTRASVQHHVVLSIVGVDRVDFGYYEGKRRQEELVRNGPLPFTIVRATQFHEFAQQLLDRSPGPVAVLPRMRVQPVAASEVGRFLAETATGSALGTGPDIAGPEVLELVSMARQVAARAGRARRVLALPALGRTGRALADGALLPAGPATLGTIPFNEWLAGAQR